MEKQKEYKLSGCVCVCLEEKFGDIWLECSYRDAGVLQPGALAGGVFY